MQVSKESSWRKSDFGFFIVEIKYSVNNNLVIMTIVCLIDFYFFAFILIAINGYLKLLIKAQSYGLFAREYLA
jgi:hypothetical protein